jgi:hypothetical protein
VVGRNLVFETVRGELEVAHGGRRIVYENLEYHSLRQESQRAPDLHELVRRTRLPRRRLCEHSPVRRDRG